MKIINEKLTVTDLENAEIEAATTSIEGEITIYLYFCERKNEYSIHSHKEPYAPIFSGGYTPKCVGTFVDGIKVSDN